MAQLVGYLENGYGVSIINHGYGVNDGSYELALLDVDGNIIKENPVIAEYSDDDVVGWLDHKTVVEIVKKVETLPPIKKEIMPTAVKTAFTLINELTAGADI